MSTGYTNKKPDMEPKKITTLGGFGTGLRGSLNKSNEVGIVKQGHRLCEGLQYVDTGEQCVPFNNRG